MSGIGLFNHCLIGGQSCPLSSMLSLIENLDEAVVREEYRLFLHVNFRCALMMYTNGLLQEDSMENE